MSLGAGNRIGPYEIRGSLGAGGMGEVFRARDTKLNRDVAIKVLPKALAGDADRLARFTREAQILASLNHPGIAAIHGLEEDGASRTIALVMELVEGEDLARRLARGAVPPDEAILIARQIAEALEEAHERGVVHRDLKPANVKLAPDGKVKVLDFGLAKALGGDAGTTNEAPGSLSHSPTMSQHATEAGLILGTAAYMSPEQARGKPVDKRADVWSFGVVLFEMLSGKRLFAGETVSDVLAAVLRQEPDWAALPSGTPSAARRLLERCLVRDPRSRLRDLGEARIALGETADAAPLVDGPSPARSSRRAIALWFLAGAALSAVLVLAALRRGGGSSPEAPTHVAVNLPPTTRLALGRGSAVALSPDGRRLAYAAVSGEKTQLYLKALDRPSSEVVPETVGATNPFFSPDGQWIGFFADGKLKKVSLSGGAPVVIAEASNPRGEAWGPDDTIYLVPDNSSGIARVSARDGSRREAVTARAPGELSHRWPSLLPGGGLLYSVWDNSGWDGSKIMALSPPSAQSKEVVAVGGGYPKVLRDPERGRAYLVYARSDGLLAAPFDESRVEVTGTAVPLVDGMVTNLSGGAHYDLSSSGTLAYVPGANAERDRSLAWVARDGTVKPVPGSYGASRYWSLAADGKRIVRHTFGGERAIWIDDLEAGTHQRAVASDRDSGPVIYPIWAKDPNAIIYSVGAPAQNLVYRRLGARGGADQLTRSDRPQSAMSVSPDGRTLIYQEYGKTTAADLWTLALPPPGRADSPPVKGVPFLETPASEVDPVFSPDGRWVVYAGNDTGRFEVYLAAFPARGDRIQVSSEGGLHPAWSPSGDEIVFRSPSGAMMAAAFHGAATPRVEKPRTLFDASKYEALFSVAPDGKRFLMMPLLPTEGDATEVRLVLNVLAEIRRRIPD